VTQLAARPFDRRFRGFLPVVVDVETAGFDEKTDALLEIAAVTLRIAEQGLEIEETSHHHLEPFPGANMDPASLEFTGIDPFNPLRYPVSEHQALQEIFKVVRKAMRRNACQRAILVGHNPSFDLGFVKAAVQRTGIRNSPFHRFSTFDTATLGGLIYGQTVLSRAVQAAGLAWNESQAHSALYDAERTAQLFCTMVNRWERMLQRCGEPAPMSEPEVVRQAGPEMPRGVWRGKP